MFTGIIEKLGRVVQNEFRDKKLYLTVETTLSSELKIDQSVAHNGICLTVVEKTDTNYTVCAVHETIEKTTIGHWQAGQTINLERGLIAGARLDGHIVQGHVDTTGTCIVAKEENGNWQFQFSYPAAFANLIIEKGSIVINGVSLTCYNLKDNTFEVTIIPYTYEHTNFDQLKVGDSVNLEFDVLGKYLQRHISLST
jgi:riboflavin synthase